VGLGEVHLHLPRRTEDPRQQVEEMDADVGGDPPRFLHIPFPGIVIPAPARGDIGQLDLVHLVRWPGGDALAQGEQGGVDAQLEQGPDAVAALAFHLLEGVEVPGIEHQRLFADHLSADAQREVDMDVVQIIGRADGDVIDAPGLAAAAQLFGVAVKALELGERVDVGEPAVEDPDRVTAVAGSDEGVAGVADGLQMARGDIAGGADEGKVFHENLQGWINAQPECNQIGKKNKMQN